MVLILDEFDQIEQEEMLGSAQMGTGIIDIIKKAGSKLFGFPRKGAEEFSGRILGPLLLNAIKGIIKIATPKPKPRDITKEAERRRKLGFRV